MRLIDADVLCETLTKREEFYHNGKDYNTASAIHMVKEIYVRNEPTVDAEPIRHGHWMMDKGYNECSICGCNEGITPYCPNCGARMDEVEE